MSDNGRATDQRRSGLAAPPRPSSDLHQAIHSEDQRKSERFIQTAFREWAFARAYQNSEQRSAELPTGYIATIGIGQMVA